MNRLAIVFILASLAACDSKGDAIGPPIIEREMIGDAHDSSDRPVEQAEESPEDQPEPPGGDRCFQLELDLEDYPSCCDAGGSRCVPSEEVPAGLAHLGSSCGRGDLCMPNRFLRAVDKVEPVSCTSMGDAPGACMSACTPEIQSYRSNLPQNRCESNELCVPCISPVDGEPTGACEAVQCRQQSGSSMNDPDPDPEPELESEYSCENPPEEAIIDVEILPVCGIHARCVPTPLVEPDLRDDLSSCENGEGVCVPEELVETQGFWTPNTCQFPGGLEGRCLSTVLPAIAERAHELPQGSCQEHERCSPCCDPFTGEMTDACTVGCDEGPAEGTQCEPIFTPCCEDRGECLARELIPAGDRGSLERDQCDRGMLCVPHLVREEDPQPRTCRGEMLLLGNSYTGVCLPDCLKVPLEILMVSRDCARQEKCVPCRGPLGRPTGAPGCPD